MQSVHGVPMPIYRGFQLLADAGDVILPVANAGTPFDQSGPLTVMATRNSTTGTAHVYLSNFAPDDGKGPRTPAAVAENAVGAAACSKTAPNPCTATSCFL